MKSILLIFMTVTGIFSHAQTSKPNIIVFFIDDMGWQDCSVPFWDSITPLNKLYHTPNMERLANEGMKFTNAYATPVCTPSRASMLTGMNAAHHGITNWTSPEKISNSDNPDSQMESVSWMKNGLSPIDGIPFTAYATPFPQLLKSAGYFTIHVGKAHWASIGTPGCNPYNMGFMVNISGHAAGHPQSYYGKDNYGNIPQNASVHAVPDLEEYFGSDTFLTEALTLEAIKAMETAIQNKQPFYLNMAHYAIHAPIMADYRFYEKYIATGMDSTEAKYASLIEGMDKSLGDLMNFLKQKGVEKNTAIIFMSDNGGLSSTPIRGGLPNTHNLPLKSGKGSVYEGGIRVPMLVKWPGVVKPKSTARQSVIIEDFFPTILQMAGIKNYKTTQIIDGKSLMPIYKNPNFSDSTRTLIWHFPHSISREGPGINYFSAIRRGDWKMVYNMRNGTKELYKITTDISETTDVSKIYPSKTKQLSDILSFHLKEWKSQMPKFKNTGKMVPLPNEN